MSRLVRLTEHHDPTDDDLPGQVLCDADLAILAAPPERYDAYVTGVRRDYAYVSDPDFAVGRTAVLRDLASRGRLFHTAYAREHWEPPRAPTWPASWRGSRRRRARTSYERVARTTGTYDVPPRLSCRGKRGDRRGRASVLHSR